MRYELYGSSLCGECQAKASALRAQGHEVEEIDIRDWVVRAEGGDYWTLDIDQRNILACFVAQGRLFPVVFRDGRYVAPTKEKTE